MNTLIRLRRSALALLAAIAVVLPAVADENPPPKPESSTTRSAPDESKSTHQRMAFDGDYCGRRSHEIIGSAVHNDANKNIGEVKDLAVDPDTGQVAYGVLSFGGTLGMGDKLFAIPWRSFNFQDNGEIELAVTKEQLKQAEGFDKNDWPNMADERWALADHANFNQTPYWEYGDRLAPRSHPATVDKSAREHPQEGDDQTTEKVQQQTQEGQSNSGADLADNDDKPSAMTANPPDTATDMNSRRIVQISKMVGANVDSFKEEKLGSIEDVVIDVGAGRIAYVVLGSGGVLGIGEQLSAAPWDMLRVQDEHTVLLDVDKDKLAKAPSIEKDSWPAEHDKSYVVRLYRYYGAAPYWENSQRSRRVSDAR